MTEPILDSVDMKFIETPITDQLWPALLAAIDEFDPLLKDATNPHFHSKFSTHSAILKSTRPSLSKHGLLVVFQSSIGRNGGIVLMGRVVHAASSQWFGALWPLNPTKSDPQGEGSAATYAKRYMLKALLNLADEDDDGNAASERPEPRQVQRPVTPRPPAASPEASGRPWLQEATQLTGTKAPVEKRREGLLALMEECRAFGELTAELYAQFVGLGNALKAEVAAA